MPSGTHDVHEHTAAAPGANRYRSLPVSCAFVPMTVCMRGAAGWGQGWVDLLQERVRKGELSATAASCEAAVGSPSRLNALCRMFGAAALFSSA